MDLVDIVDVERDSYSYVRIYGRTDHPGTEGYEEECDIRAYEIDLDLPMDEELAGTLTYEKLLELVNLEWDYEARIFGCSEETLYVGETSSTTPLKRLQRDASNVNKGLLGEKHAEVLNNSNACIVVTLARGNDPILAKKCQNATIRANPGSINRNLDRVGEGELAKSGKKTAEADRASCRKYRERMIAEGRFKAPCGRLFARKRSLDIHLASNKHIENRCTSPTPRRELSPNIDEGVVRNGARIPQ